MSKHVGAYVLGAVLLVAGCATAPPAADPPRPAEPPEARPVEPAREAPLRVGVIVSTTGSAVLQQYADLVLDGVRLGAEQQSTARRGVELVVRDDGGTAAGAAAAVRELEAAGVRAIIGPLVDEAVMAAARSRGSDQTLIISPTAVSAVSTARNVFALNVVDTRGAAALGGYARRYARVGVLYARSPDMTAQARAFMDAYSRGGHGSVRDAGFDPGATSVAAQLGRLRDGQVEAIFFPATERQLQLVLPQIDYFGLGAAQLMGTESWVSDAARSVPARLLEGAIIATPLWQESPDLAWRDFVELYEAKHRRTLDNPVPALGYDALVLAVRALSGSGPAVRDLRGATGVLSLQDGGVTRKPFLVRILSGRLVPVN
jgi:ABC-type branched-subunit amino acid transport system substrate-binding protein